MVQSARAWAAVPFVATASAPLPDGWECVPDLSHRNAKAFTVMNDWWQDVCKPEFLEVPASSFLRPLSFGFGVREARANSVCKGDVQNARFALVGRSAPHHHGAGWRLRTRSTPGCWNRTSGCRTIHTTRSSRTWLACCKVARCSHAAQPPIISIVVMLFIITRR